MSDRPGQFRDHLRSNIVGYVALFFALSAGAYAGGLADNSVRSRHIVNGDVRSADVADDSTPFALLGNDIANSSLAGRDILNSSLGPQELAPGALNADVEVTATGPNEVVLTGEQTIEHTITVKNLGPRPTRPTVVIAAWTGNQALAEVGFPACLGQVLIMASNPNASLTQTVDTCSASKMLAPGESESFTQEFEAHACAGPSNLVLTRPTLVTTSNDPNAGNDAELGATQVSSTGCG